MSDLYEKFYSKEYLNICKRINRAFFNDLLQDTIEILLKKNWDLEAVYKRGELKFLFYKVAYLTNKSCSFGKRYGIKESNELHELTDNSEVYDKRKDIILDDIFDDNHSDEMEYYYRNITRLYIKYGSFSEVERKTGIANETICTDINKYKKQLKEKYEKTVNSGRNL